MLEVVTKPDISVVSLQQVKAHLRLDHAEDDDYLIHLIAVATEWVEDLIESPLLTTTFISHHPGATKIKLPRSYIQEVVSVTGIDRNNKRIDLKYTLEGGENLTICLLQTPHEVEIKFKAGFGVRPIDVPAQLRQAVINHVACSYECRTDLSKDHYLNLLRQVHPYRRIRLS